MTSTWGREGKLSAGGRTPGLSSDSFDYGGKKGNRREEGRGLGPVEEKGDKNQKGGHAEISDGVSDASKRRSVFPKWTGALKSDLSRERGNFGGGGERVY